WKVMDDITSKVTNQVPGIDFDTHQLMGDMIGDMVGRRQPVVINLSAKDPSVLPKVAAKVAKAIQKVPGIEPASVNNGITPAGDALEIHVDSAAATANGITPADIKDQMANYFDGQVVTTYLGTTQDVGVRLWAHPPNREKLYRSDVANLPLRSPDGHIVTLGTVASVEFVGGQPELN